MFNVSFLLSGLIQVWFKVNQRAVKTCFFSVFLSSFSLVVLVELHRQKHDDVISFIEQLYSLHLLFTGLEGDIS